MDILFFILLTFCVRLFPRIIRPLKTDSDTWYHISSVNSIVKNNYKIPECNFGFLLGGKYDYPYFAHWITALFVNKHIIKLEKYISPIIDTIYISVGYYYINFLFSTYNIEIENLTIKYFLLAIFSISMVKVSTGPRIYSFTPRIFGELFIFIFFISIHTYYLTDNYIFLFISLIFSAIALNTSTFGSQVLFLSSILLSVLLFSFVPLFCFIFSILLAYLISFGHYKNILQQQLKYSWQYATYGQFNHPAVKNRNKIKQYINIFKLIYEKKFKEAYGVFMSDLTFFNVFYKNLDIVFGFIILLFIAEKEVFLSPLFLSFFIIFVFVSFKPLLFLGESDRYLDYLVIFSIFLFLTNLSETYLILLIGLQFLLFLFTLLLYFKSSDHYGKNFLDATAFIKENIKNKEKYVIHGILGTYINYPLSVLTDIKSLAIETNYVFNLAKNKRLMPKDTLYTNDFGYLYSNYGVNIIIVNKNYLLNNDFTYDFDLFESIYENNQYIVFKRKEVE